MCLCFVFYSPFDFQCRSNKFPYNNNVHNSYCDFDYPINQTEGDVEDSWDTPPEIMRMIEQEEKAIEPHGETTELVNLGTEENRREVKVGTAMGDSVRAKLVQLLREYVDVFA